MKNNKKTVGADAHIHPAPKECQNNSGITLIALVVTIIVLLILAGVTLKLLTGGDGIIAKARWAEFLTEYGKLDEQKQLYVAEKQMDEIIKEKTSKVDFKALFTNISYATEPIETFYPVDLNQPFFISEAVDTLKSTICYVENLQYSDLSDKTKVDLYHVDLTVLPNLNLHRNYIINIVTGMLYYIDGETYKGLIYHTPRYGVNQEKADTTGMVTYNANGGANAPASQLANYGEIVNINFSTVPTKTGYTFQGWATTSDAANATYTSGGTTSFTMGTNDVTLYAVWRINTYMVTYNANGGTGSVPSAQTQNYNTTVTVSFSPKPTQSGYLFQGWALTSGATSPTYTSEGTKTFTLTENVTLYAVWKQDAQPATTTISATNYGDKANYSANGVTDWKIFLNDGTNIYLIASDYVSIDKLSLTSAVKTTTNAYIVREDIKGQLVDWLTTTSNWDAFASGISGATSTGGPTLGQFAESYNAKHGTLYSDDVKGKAWDLLDATDQLYVPHNEKWNDCLRLLDCFAVQERWLELVLLLYQ